MKYFYCVYLLLTLITIVLSEEECSSDCDISKCQPPEECLSGMVKDRCNCCSICGKREGERCFNETLKRQLSRNYKYHGTCGENLECRMRTDMEANDPPEAVCYCVKVEPICGNDGITYENECQLTEARYKKRDGLVAASRGPCKAVPKIVSPPEDIANKTGSYVAFSCEVKGWPVPVIEWRVQRDDVEANTLPSDDPHIAVQSRGGPSNYEVTGWLQLLDISIADQGSYSCIARNSEGETKATAKLVITDYRRKAEGNYENEII